MMYDMYMSAYIYTYVCGCVRTHTLPFFVEVRYRGETSFVKAMLTVDTRKQRKLSRAAAMFLAMNRRYAEHVCRFDIVGVNCGHDAALSIDWMRDAFRPAL